MPADIQNDNWPAVKFTFIIDWGNITGIPFQEVSGLDAEMQSAEYRTGSSTNFPAVKKPAIATYSNVSLKKGIFTVDSAHGTWHEQLKTNTIERTNVIIKLLNEAGNATVTWTLKNAWPTKTKADDLMSEGAEMVIQLIEVAHEGITTSTS